MSEVREKLKQVLNIPIAQKDAIDYFTVCLSECENYQIKNVVYYK